MQAEPQLAKKAILEVALQLAARSSWDAVHLFDVAREMGVSLAEVQRHYANKDAIAEAWFDLADEAMLRLPGTPGWERLSQRERLHDAYGTWLNALAPHRAVTREMLGYKLQPEHIHLQVRGVLRISDTVQMIREVALLPETGWRRETAESVLTTIYLTVFTHWLFDNSPAGQRTERLLDRLLRAADFCARALPRSFAWPASWRRAQATPR